jgi:transposase DDE domain
LSEWVKDQFGWGVEVVLRPKESPKIFNVIPKRWIVERTFAWLENYRRLTIDYEFLSETAEAMVGVVFIQIISMYL